MNRSFLLLGWMLLAGMFSASNGRVAAASPWEGSLVTLEITRKQYDYLQPWTRRFETFQKMGLVIGPREILTTAEYLNDQTLVRAQKGGRGQWWNGTLDWIDYHANLAVVSVPDDKFWTGLTAVELANPAPTQGAVQIVRWRNGILEVRKGEINRLSVRRGKLSMVETLHMEVDSEINGAGWAETVAMDSKVVGLACSQNGNSCLVIPMAFVQPILEARKNHGYRGLGYFDFVWQKAENPATLRYLKLEGEPRGVLVVDFVRGEMVPHALKVRDIILKVEGFEIDNEGDYVDPNYGNLSLENLASRGKWAGDPVELVVWRDGHELNLRYPLPAARYDNELVPFATFDQEPEYFLVGGLVFEPLTEAFLRSWGGDWKRKAPFRLAYDDQEKPTQERPALVILSIVLPDPYNIGYQDYRFMALDKVNGQRISRLPDLVEAFKQAQDGFHRIEYRSGEAVQRMILDAATADAATRRIMQRYGITKDRFLAPPRDLLAPARDQ